MKFVICLCLIAVAASSHLPQQRPFIPVGIPYFLFPLGLPSGQGGGEEQYAASLGGAQVGLYGKSHGGYGSGNPGFNPYGNYGNSEVTGASLGGAKVGLYGKEH